MGFKLQSSMEYLMTYGWAILAIVAIFVVLYSLGVFNNANSSAPIACIAVPGYGCKNPTLGHDAFNTLSFQFGHSTGQTFYKVIIYISPQGSIPNSAGFPTIATNALQPVIPILQPGSVNSVTIGLDPNNGLVSNTVGTIFQGFIWMNYSNTPSGVPTSTFRVASINIKVS